MAAAGVSTMTPTCLMPKLRARFAKSAASAGVLIIGAITQSSISMSFAAAAIASNWRVKTPSLVRVNRQPRTPSAGFSS